MDSRRHKGKMTDNVRLGNWVGEGWRRMEGGAVGILLGCSSKCGEGKVFLSICWHWLLIRAIVWDTLSSLTPAPLCPPLHRNPISSVLWELAFPGSPAGCFLLLLCDLLGWGEPQLGRGDCRAVGGLCSALLWGMGLWGSPLGLDPSGGGVRSWCLLWKLL